MHLRTVWRAGAGLRGNPGALPPTHILSQNNYKKSRDSERANSDVGLIEKNLGNQ